jgi:subtilase family serine protease
VAFISGRRLGQLLAVLAVIAAPVIYGATGAGASARRLRVGDVVPLPAHAATVGAVPAAKPIQVTVALEPQDSAGLQALATGVSSPGSPEYRHYLTTAQFAQRFGATGAEVSAVQSALRTDGLQVSAPASNRLTMDASGTAAAVEKAFSTPLAQVRLHGGRVAYRNTATPTVSGGLQGDISEVIGLQSVYRHTPLGPLRPRAAVHGTASRRAQAAAKPAVATGGPQPCAAARNAAAYYGTSTTPGTEGYTADELADYYGFSGLYHAGDQGAGQTVDIFELEGNYPSDITAFQQCYGTHAKVTYTKVDGGAAAPVAGQDGYETELDVETVIGLAPKASIDVYQAPNTNTDTPFIDELSTIVAHGTGKVISISYGGCEPDSVGDPAIITENTLFKEAAVEGKSVFASSGDEGSSGCAADTEPAGPPDTTDDELAAEDPASQPWVTGVGGTVLSQAGSTNGAPNLWSPGAAAKEGVWNDGTQGDPVDGYQTGGTGGGDSIFWAMPGYQSGSASGLGVINSHSSSGSSCHTSSGNYCREVPDVSATADPYTGYMIYYAAAGAPDWFGIGGTSGSSPLWAALATLVNASSACAAKSVGFMNPALYDVAGTSAYSKDFRDINAADPISPGQPNNDALYDNTLAPGVGPVADGTHGLYPVKSGYDQATGLGSPIASSLAGTLCSARAASLSLQNPGSRTGTVGRSFSLQLHLTGTAQKLGITYRARNLPAGLLINSRSGLISGVPRTPARRTVAVSAADVYGHSASARFRLTVMGRPTARAVKLSGLGRRRPRLRFIVGAGTYAPALRAISFTVPRGVSFARRHKPLQKGIKVWNGRRRASFTTRLRKGILTITFRKTLRRAAITVTRPTLRVSRTGAKQVRRRAVKKLTFSIRTRDARRTTTKIPESLKKFS